MDVQAGERDLEDVVGAVGELAQRQAGEDRQAVELTGTVTGVKVAPAGPLASERVAVAGVGRVGDAERIGGLRDDAEGVVLRRRSGGGWVTMVDLLARP